MRSPSKAQIEFAKEICGALNIEFPTCSQEFTAYCYYNFIADHINEYREVLNSDPSFDEEMDWYAPITPWGDRE